MQAQKKTSWGGIRKGAGRKKSENPKKTVAVRFDEVLLPIVLDLKAKHKAGIEIKNLFSVANNQDDLKLELKSWKQRNLELVLEKDREHTKAVKLTSRVLSLKSEITSQKNQIEAMKHQVYDCQFLTKNGARCTRTARLKADWHGVEINTCIQHSKAK